MQFTLIRPHVIIILVTIREIQMFIVILISHVSVFTCAIWVSVPRVTSIVVCVVGLVYGSISVAV